ncbi:hypothetical protein ACIQOU_18420 [Streptomyces sp. NPDC091279]|uniref:hypothetical protein n=1 Tax=unclassified Streptomyces TaxID=2593676 RepID=UPI0038203FC2
MADARRKLRSSTVVLGGMGLLAAALTACSSEPDKRCVDRSNYDLDKGYRVVSDKNCKSSRASSSWYYGGTKSGSRVEDGSFVKPGKGSGSSGGSGGSSVDRGGFGSGKGSSGG